MSMQDLQLFPSKLCLIKYELENNVHNLILFNRDFPITVNCPLFYMLAGKRKGNKHF